MHMSNQIILNLAFTPHTWKLVHAHAKPNCVQPCIQYFESKLINCLNSKYKMTNIGHWKFIIPKNLWCTCQNRLHCVVRYLFKFLLYFHMYVPLSPHVPLDQNTMDAQWSFEYLVLPPNQGLGFILKNYHNSKSYQNMLTILGFNFFYHKLQLCFICDVQYTPFTCGKELLKFWNLETYFEFLKFKFHIFLIVNVY